MKKKIKFDFRFVWIVYAVGTLLAGLIWAQILAKSGAEWWIHFFTGASTLASLAGFHFIFLQLRDIKSEVQEKDRKGESQRFSQSLLTIMKYYSVQITNPDEIGIQTHVFFWSLIHDLVTAYLALLGKIYIIEKKIPIDVRELKNSLFLMQDLLSTISVHPAQNDLKTNYQQVCELCTKMNSQMLKQTTELSFE